MAAEGRIREAAYGTWDSPISPELVSNAVLRFDAVSVHEATGKVYLTEMRPSESGRACIVEFDLSTGVQRDVLPAELSARSCVHGYGGGAVSVDQRLGRLIITDFKTHGVFSVDPASGVVESLIGGDPKVFFGDFDASLKDPNWVLAIQEDHRIAPTSNKVVAINISNKEFIVLAQGADFYTHPKFSPDGSSICWLQWNFPNMPWDSAELHVANFDDGALSEEYVVAGKQGNESIQQPRWNSDGTLLFCGDRTGYWQLYRHDPRTNKTLHINLPTLQNAEFAWPEFFLGSKSYACLTSNLVVAMYMLNGQFGMCLIDLLQQTCCDLDSSYTSPGFQTDALHRISGTEFVAIVSSEDGPMSLTVHRLSNAGSLVDVHCLKTVVAWDMLPPKEWISKPQFISFPRVGTAFTGNSHAIFWPPTTPFFQAPAGSLPPLIVSVHGGPTHDAKASLSMEIQYWTTRGFAWVDVNYAGSSGYGREYRELLKGNWGVIDAEDVVSCVHYLASRSIIDRSRVGIRGGSAGGYAVLRCMTEYPEVWAGGISLFGVCCLQTLEKTTHKFESRYLEGLLLPRSPVSAEEKERLYQERSPLYHAQQIKAPVLLLQGREDIVVPPDQAEMMESAIKEAIRERDNSMVPEDLVKVVIYEGEGHGFIKAHTLISQKAEEVAWWSKTLLRPT
ncbi:uncharacterized protein PV06_03450 [Exophiala oligosperma]|uniref:Peptidase S9 prolyl oligopeptidase catalytic domain-containing protein n=1 Tax=Exophiala oligosperma TaxID=215243 RepID=A0A0D2C5J7_9EURO|nr:uncharacterized protein PV06_03450 [Exophiala oligosperma]KIW45027.1 hypothetical protein PV06_03450 [Exophiala oligosperma]